MIVQVRILRPHCPVYFNAPSLEIPVYAAVCGICRRPLKFLVCGIRMCIELLYRQTNEIINKAESRQPEQTTEYNESLSQSEFISLTNILPPHNITVYRSLQTFIHVTCILHSSAPARDSSFFIFSIFGSCWQTERGFMYGRLELTFDISH